MSSYEPTALKMSSVGLSVAVTGFGELETGDLGGLNAPVAWVVGTGGLRTRLATDATDDLVIVTCCVGAAAAEAEAEAGCCTVAVAAEVAVAVATVVADGTASYGFV